jgi:hypothetical protein
MYSVFAVSWVIEVDMDYSSGKSREFGASHVHACLGPSI